MKQVYFISVTLLAICCLKPSSSFAQDPSINDPLFGENTIAAADDIMLAWVNINEDSLYVQRFNYISSPDPCDNNITETTLFSEFTLHIPGISSSAIDLAVTNVDNDPYDEALLLLAEPHEGQLTLMLYILKVENEEFVLKSVTPVTALDDGAKQAFNLKLSELDGDYAHEVLISYTREGTGDHVPVYLHAFDVDADYSITELGNSILGQALIGLNSNLYDIDAIDFNQDGIEEILFASGQKENSKKEINLSIWQLERVGSSGYSLSEASTLDPVTINEDNDFSMLNLQLATGDFYAANDMDAMVVYNIKSDRYNEIYFVPLYVSAPLDLIFDLEKREKVRDFGETCCTGMGITVGDINTDRKDDLQLLLAGDLYIFEMSPDTSGNKIGQRSISSDGFLNFANKRLSTIRDLDGSDLEETWIGESVALAPLDYNENREGDYSTLSVFQFNNCSGNGLKVRSSADISTPGLSAGRQTPFAMATGHFDDAGIYLGLPQVYLDKKILQPLVVLNAPPIHFDQFGNEAYDISDCFGGQDCDFSSVYSEGTTQEEQIVSEQTQDWGIDATAYSHFQFGGNKLETYLTGKYGETFSNYETKSASVSVGVNVLALNDDMIFATSTEEEVWEYPVYDNGEQTGFLSVTVPIKEESSWFPSKSVQGFNYLQQHEHGNIFSYPSLDSIEARTFVAETIKGGTKFNIGPNTQHLWKLEFVDFESSGATSENNVGLGVGFLAQVGYENELEVSAEPFGVGVGTSTAVKAVAGLDVNGNYSETDFTSHEVGIRDELALEIKMGNISGALTGYSITPFAYWTESGILVIDYAVDPDVSGPGLPETWWSQMYGDKPDPALLLPWRLDPEKGYQIGDESQRQLSKDMVVEPRNASPGDTVIVYTRVHNYSLKDLEQAVNVKWYMGDPDNGGEQITGLDGETSKNTRPNIEARGYEWAHMAWVLPEFEGRIYAVIDGDNEIDEIHENNNKAWVGMGLGATPVENIPLTQNASLLQNYPNPFSGSTFIPFNLLEAGRVYIDILNVQGQKVDTVVDQHFSPGYHELSYNTKLPAGLYFCRMRYGDQVSSRKMVLMR